MGTSVGTVAVHGLRISYRRSGRGRAVLLVHGGGDDSRAWTPQLEALSDEFELIAWDEPGAGGSDDVPEGFGLEDYADCLAGLIRALDTAPTTTVGLSWGTTVVLELYRRHPEVLRSLVLADAYAGWRGSLGSATAQSRLSAVRAAVDRARTGESESSAPGLFAGEPPTQFVPLLEAMARDRRAGSLLTAATALAGADLTDVLPSIAVPTQLIWGALDGRSPLDVARTFERRIPGATLAVLPGCGHVSNLDAPRAFTDTVRAFLRDRG